MYKQRPAAPALIAAACVLALGGYILLELKKRVDDGMADESLMLFAGCVTCGIVGSLVIVAFARYQFTHLWKHPDQAFRKTK